MTVDAPKPPVAWDGHSRGMDTPMPFVSRTLPVNQSTDGWKFRSNHKLPTLSES